MATIHPSIVYGTISATIRVTDRHGHIHTLRCAKLLRRQGSPRDGVKPFAIPREAK